MKSSARKVDTFTNFELNTLCSCDVECGVVPLCDINFSTFWPDLPFIRVIPESFSLSFHFSPHCYFFALSICTYSSFSVVVFGIIGLNFILNFFPGLTRYRKHLLLLWFILPNISPCCICFDVVFARFLFLDMRFVASTINWALEPSQLMSLYASIFHCERSWV